jgi:hypothetical protein
MSSKPQIAAIKAARVSAGTRSRLNGGSEKRALLNSVSPAAEASLVAATALKALVGRHTSAQLYTTLRDQGP